MTWIYTHSTKVTHQNYNKIYQVRKKYHSPIPWEQHSSNRLKHQGLKGLTIRRRKIRQHQGLPAPTIKRRKNHEHINSKKEHSLTPPSESSGQVSSQKKTTFRNFQTSEGTHSNSTVRRVQTQCEGTHTNNTHNRQ